MIEVHGWGRYPVGRAELWTPQTENDCVRLLQAMGGECIPRGAGRSYGDSAHAPRILQSTHLDHFLALDEGTGVLTAQAGVTLKSLLELTVPKGWMLPVTPGSAFVTVGGAIASDVHGKNHHGAGTFGTHVIGLRLLLGTGERVEISPTQHPDLFKATCGGMGLTGMILSATLQLMPVRSSQMEQISIKSPHLEAACEAFDAHANAAYSVAWIDCVARGKNMGRSVLMLGAHCENGPLQASFKPSVSVPFDAPTALLNQFTLSAFNALYYTKARHMHRSTVHMAPYFYPLDAIGHWNRLYGKKGFVQYQCVIPIDNGVRNLRTLLGMIADSGEGSFLAVLKRFGKANDHLLSFPMEGYTLALDFKVCEKTFALLRRLDEEVVGMGGRIYLTKDALMSERTFKTSYPQWERFEHIRTQYGAVGVFASDQSRRLGLS